MHPTLVVGIVGWVGIAVAVAAGFGLIPGLSAAGCFQNCGGEVSPAFVWTVGQGNAITLTDASKVVSGSPTTVATGVQWGDGTPESSGVLGSSFVHTYAVSGTYAVIEVVTYLTCTNLVCLPQVAATAANVTTGTSGASEASLVASFSASVSGNTVSAIDTSTVTGSLTVQSVIFTWGNGSASGSLPLGGNASHTFPGPGTYTVRDSVTWSFRGYPLASNASQGVKVGSPFVLSPFWTAVLVGSSALLVTQAIPPTRPPFIAAPVAAVAGIASYLLSLHIGG